MFRLLVEPAHNRFTWAVADEAGKVWRKGASPSLWDVEEIRGQYGIEPAQTYIEIGFRTSECKSAGKHYGWILVKARRDRDGKITPAIAAEIEEATRDL